MLLGTHVAESVLPTRRRFARRAPFVTGFGSGMGNDVTLACASRRVCRRRLAHCLRQYRDVLSCSSAERAAFNAALTDLKNTPHAHAWSYRVTVDRLDVTFWLSSVSSSASA